MHFKFRLELSTFDKEELILSLKIKRLKTKMVICLPYFPYMVVYQMLLQYESHSNYETKLLVH